MKMSKKTGQALILVCLAIVFLVTLTAPLFNVVLSERSVLDQERLRKEAFYLAEGALEDAINHFTSDIANFVVNNAYPDNGAYNTVYAPSVAFPQGAQVNSNIVAAEVGNRVLNVSGIIVGARNYVVISTCQHPANANIIVTLNQAITIKETAAFQYAVFYNDILEAFPGANMTFNGSVHCNSDIYLGSDGHILKINSDYLHSAGDIYNYRLNPTGGNSGTVNILVDGTADTFRPMSTDPPLDSANHDWTAKSQDNTNGWNGTVRSSVHGVTKLAVPSVGSITPDGYYAGQAGLVITGTAAKRGGVTLPPSPIPAHGVMPSDTITMSNKLYDAREGKYITTTNIDLKKLAGYSGAVDSYGNPIQDYDNNLPVNGLIYATSSNNETPVAQTAIRLVNGSTIYSANVYNGTDTNGNTVTTNSGGLAVVTNDPVYIQGNYNTSDKPASIICDSVNILSNNWSDTNSSKGIGSRTASATTVDAALIAGVDDDSTSGKYNGGLENYTRLLESWSGVTLTINGCFTELWHTQDAQGLWPSTGTVYNPPTRSWSFDANLKNGIFPPFTPKAIEAQRSTWWKP